ncbi:uncharacterized protein LOC112562445 [Pomacea canaliculata]|uniref:uncharacterized protein LOC112562445 n=1 Tax=Pomacea canaliculata TaxID=400727 RepID=UPI000D732D27|nr:uncharacterized protein LOC112562445 [Pomacea canaliculata]
MTILIDHVKIYSGSFQRLETSKREQLPAMNAAAAILFVCIVNVVHRTEGVPKDGKPDDTFYDCTGLDDGLYIGDCTHFYRCENETTRMLPCPGKLVVNEKQMWCDYKSLVKPPCGTAPNCTGIIDGNYPDFSSRCQQFYTCLHEEFYGYTKCAASLIFNPEKNNCDWPFLVKPPCGTGSERVWPSKPDENSAV